MSSSKKIELFDTKHSWVPYAVILALLGIALTFFPLQAEKFGTLDFIQYWSAWKLLANGQNPYDPVLLYETEAALTSHSSSMIYSWNPPWTYTLLAPFFIPSFSVAATLWCLFQVAALFFIASNAPRALKVRDLGLVGGAYAVLFFLPSLYSIGYGQLGILFTLSLTCFLLGVNTRRYALAGVALVPLTLKPHLFALCAIPGLLWLSQIPREGARRFVVGALGAFTILLGITVLIQPSSLSWWLEAMTSTPVGQSKLVHFKDWMTHTTVTAVRLLTFKLCGFIPTWPMIVIPTATFTLTSLYFWLRRPYIEWSTLLPPMLCVSMATSSYGWVYDHAALVLSQYLLLAHVAVARDKAYQIAILLSLIAFQVLPLLLIETIDLPVHSHFFLPWGFLGLLFISYHYDRVSARK